MPLLAGTPAPSFHARNHLNPRFAFDSVGGHWVLVAILPPPGAARDAALALVSENLSLFRGTDVVFFGVLPDAASYEAADQSLPWRWFEDEAGEIRRRFAAEKPDGTIEPMWVLIDPSFRLIGSLPLARGPEMMERVRRLGPPAGHAGVALNAPVLIVPRIFDRDFCRRLIQVYRDHGGEPSGVMRVIDGKTVGVLNDFKKRRDAPVTDPALQAQAKRLISRRLLPEIRKAFQFEATQIERYIVARYDAADGGYFRPHRDDTTPGTAHRKFAVSMNLNAEEFAGGDLRFPEFGPRTYRPPTGGAVVFSCSLLHEATPVTEGERFAFLPFLYDDVGKDVRAANEHTIVPGAARMEAEPSA